MNTTVYKNCKFAILPHRIGHGYIIDFPEEAEDLFESTGYDIQDNFSNQSDLFKLGTGVFTCDIEVTSWTESYPDWAPEFNVEAINVKPYTPVTTNPNSTGIKDGYGNEIRLGDTVECVGGEYYNGFWQYRITVTVTDLDNLPDAINHAEHLEIVEKGKGVKPIMPYEDERDYLRKAREYDETGYWEGEWDEPIPEEEIEKMAHNYALRKYMEDTTPWFAEHLKQIKIDFIAGYKTAIAYDNTNASPRIHPQTP